jgi:hypothetical protein
MYIYSCQAIHYVLFLYLTANFNLYPLRQYSQSSVIVPYTVSILSGMIMEDREERLKAVVPIDG